MTVRMASAPDRWGIVRRCDAKCHNAEGPDCDCICGGKYHGSANEDPIGEDPIYDEPDVEHEEEQ